MRRLTIAFAMLLLAACASANPDGSGTEPRAAGPVFEVVNRSTSSFNVLAVRRGGPEYSMGTIRAGQTRRFVMPSRDTYIRLEGRTEDARADRNRVLVRRVN